MQRFWRVILSSALVVGALAGCNKPSTPAPTGKWGYVNKLGKFIILPQFDEAAEFKPEGAIVRKGKNLMRLKSDPPGEEADTPPGPQDTAALPELTTLRCAEGGKDTYKILNGEETIFDPTSKAETPALFDESGMVCAHFGSEFAFIDKTGKMAIPRTFKKARPFSHGKAAVFEAGKWGFINKKGVFILPPQYLEAGSFAEGLAPVKIPSEDK